jgi:hypothetical protein
VVGELCGCIEDRKEAHDYEMGGLQGIVEVTILSHRLQRGVVMKWQYLQKNKDKGCKNTLLNSGGKPSGWVSLWKSQGGGEVPWRTFQPYPKTIVAS